MTHVPSSPSKPSTTQENLSDFLSTLPKTGSAFTRFDPAYPPAQETFSVYLPHENDSQRTHKIATEKTRCLIRALKAKPPPRKRSLSATVSAPKRRRWASLEREKKQACLRVALSAACQGKGDTGILGQLRKGWRENPKKKQVVDGKVRQALCDSLERWSTLQLREYLERAGLDRPQGRRDAIESVRNHLAPEE